ncbi:MAG: hypothetical protein GF388_00175, partial [Candidatus Aegiribacteria sp.]|nr:hypothetical protein [Candidatus Aegiribacteria sp.]MBD3293871.1 hypothetical protein [Candidatus Fermentibacteria bacterium]
MFVRACGIVFIIFAFAGICLGQQTFTEVSDSLGILVNDGLGHSVAWCDFDNDGDLDAAFSNQDGSGFWLFRNDISEFVDVTSSMGLSGLGASRILWGEITGDAWSELVLDTGSGQKIFRNESGSSFTDITSGSGLSGSPVCVLDLDSDGSLDVLSLTGSGCTVLLNSGSGVFTAGPSATGDWWCAATLDYDLDGDQDIYLGTYGNDANSLLRNDVNSLVDVTSSAGVEYTGSTEGITTGDCNNDGYPDIYLANYDTPGCILFENDGDGTFTDVTAASGAQGHTDTRTAGFNDYNNDGWLDIFVSHHDFYTYSNIMWRNNGDGTFSDVGTELGLSGEFMGDYFGTAWGDYNLDGDMDLFAVGHIDKYVLFRNDQSETIPSGYVVVELQGTVSNRDAVGAKVTADLGSMTLTRWVRGGEGYHDFHSFPVELGLFDAASVQTLQIDWPSGIVDIYTDIGADQYVTAVEGDSLYTGIQNDTPEHMTPTLWLRCGPNPFRGSLSVTYPDGLEGDTRVEVYDTGGRLLRTLSG